VVYYTLQLLIYTFFWYRNCQEY